MNLCQPNSPFSCGACCGLFNLDVEKHVYKEILRNRTDKFRSEVDFQKNWTMVEYRKQQEKVEADYRKKDEHIYNCPFLGFIEHKQQRIGCMIHPVFSGDHLSQNYSFYGASICQGYDCKNKEKPETQVWIEILSSMDFDSIQYSSIAGDHIFLSDLIAFLRTKDMDLLGFWQKSPEILKKVIWEKINQGTSNITSFEIDMEPEIQRKKVFDWFSEFIEF